MLEFIKNFDTELLLAVIVMIQGYLHHRLEKRVQELEDGKPNQA